MSGGTGDPHQSPELAVLYQEARRIIASSRDNPAVAMRLVPQLRDVNARIHALREEEGRR